MKRSFAPKRLDLVLLCGALFTGMIIILWSATTISAVEATPKTSSDAAHTAYMGGLSTGLFAPDSPLTRAEAAQLLYRLLDLDVPSDSTDSAFLDVSTGAWYFEAVNGLAGAGIVGGANGRFSPGENSTRAEFVSLLVRFEALSGGLGYEDGSPATFPDVPEAMWYYDAVNRAAERGWATGFPDGSFRPEADISRAEAVVLVNRMLDRPPRTIIEFDGNKRPFPDLPTTHWAYYDILEATVTHTFVISADGSERWTTANTVVSRFTPGPQTIGGELYYVGQDGLFIRDASVGNLTFGSDGRYTTGSSELDTLVKEALSLFVDDTMTRDERLRAAFNYMADGEFTYLSRPHVAFNAKDWEVPYAMQMLKKHRGNCFSFASTFCCLARQLGFDADIVSGWINVEGTAHGWVEITAADGSVTCYDTVFEKTYRLRHQHYNLFAFTYENAPFNYIR